MTVISESLFNSIASLSHEAQNKTILRANNLLLNIMGKTVVTIQLGGTRTLHKVYVCRDLAQDILVGVDFLKAHRCVLNFESENLSTSLGVAKMSFQGLNHVCRVRVAETVMLAPSMVADIPCQIQGNTGVSPVPGVWEPEEKFKGRYRAGVLRTAITVRNGLLAVRAFNLSTKPVKIYRCSTVGSLYPLVDHGGEVQGNQASVCYTVVPPSSDSHLTSDDNPVSCGTVRQESFEDTVSVMTKLFLIVSARAPEAEKRWHHEVLATHAHCVSRGPMDLGHAKGVQHHFDTGSAEPIRVPPRRVPFYKREEMRRQVDKMLEARVIEPSESSWCSPVVLVSKPDGSQWFCVDYRALNSVTKRDLYPLPRCDEILESLAGAKWFTHLDLLRGYWQVDVAEEDKEKTSFASLDGLCQFKRLSFGLTNAPACFMRAMHRVLKGLCWSDCLVYLDDVIIFGRTLEEYRDRLAAVLSRLAGAGLKITQRNANCWLIKLPSWDTLYRGREFPLTQRK